MTYPLDPAYTPVRCWDSIYQPFPDPMGAGDSVVSSEDRTCVRVYTSLGSTPCAPFQANLYASIRCNPSTGGHNKQAPRLFWMVCFTLSVSVPLRFAIADRCLWPTRWRVSPFQISHVPRREFLHLVSGQLHRVIAAFHCRLYNRSEEPPSSAWFMRDLGNHDCWVSAQHVAEALEQPGYRYDAPRCEHSRGHN